ncbi:hypothetical protein BRD19_00330 [Halobacteriales archaeon SW_7_65_23]|nr:MAG: hypothetical protein BRD19_00330 [Halobacteriales archaeon SW_7_65_23]
MPDCTYCGESFDGEAEYVEHLRDQHDEDELSRVDRRRVKQQEGNDKTDLPLAAIAIGVAIVAALGAMVYFFALGGSSADGIEGEPLPDSGDESLLTDVESFPSEGNQHVSAGTDIEYETMPPVSGPHYQSAASAGFYTETPPLGELVHSLEHGAVVIYYDPAQMTDDAEESLRKFAETHIGPWRSVIVAPNPNADPDAAYVLTAWRNKLEMDSSDVETVRAFLAEFLGRGPENPVR